MVRFPVIKQTGEHYILLDIQIGNQIIELIDNADISASKDRQLTLIHAENIFLFDDDAA